MRYVSNTFSLNMLSLPSPGETRCHVLIIRGLSPPEAREWLMSGDFFSVVGHQSTASVLTAVTGVHIPLHRGEIVLSPGDEILVFQLGVRLPEGKVLEPAELKQLYDEGRIKLLLVTVR